MAQFTLFDKLGTPLKFRCGLKEIDEITQMLGMGLYKAAQELAGPSFFITVLWCGIKWDQREMSRDDLRKLIEKSIRAKKVTMKDIQDFVLRELAKSEALSGFAFDDDDDEDGDEPNPTKP
jgi:hypothetical protein